MNRIANHMIILSNIYYCLKKSKNIKSYLILKK